LNPKGHFTEFIAEYHDLAEDLIESPENSSGIWYSISSVLKPRQTLVYYPFARSLNLNVERFFSDFHLQVFLSTLNPNRNTSSFNYLTFSKLYFLEKKKHISTFSTLSEESGPIPFYSFNVFIKLYMFFLNIFFSSLNFFLNVIFFKSSFQLNIFGNHSFPLFYRFFFKLYLNFILNPKSRKQDSVFFYIYQDSI
jgi:hypothetical protein